MIVKTSDGFCRIIPDDYESGLGYLIEYCDRTERAEIRTFGGTFLEPCRDRSFVDTLQHVQTCDECRDLVVVGSEAKEGERFPAEWLLDCGYKVQSSVMTLRRMLLLLEDEIDA
jgi:hypothetical protein